MEQRAARIISYLFHPLLMPMYGILVITFSGTYAGIADLRELRFINMVVFGLTFAMPAAFIPLYLYIRLVRHVEMEERRERLVPYGITLVFYLTAYLLIREVPVSRVYQEFMLSACLTLFGVFIVSFFWKISAHMAGLGGVAALVISLSIILEAELMLYLMIAVISAGLAAYARLRMNAHTPLQVYSGFMLGFVTVVLVFFI